jgi:hypothetical protein
MGLFDNKPNNIGDYILEVMMVTVVQFVLFKDWVASKVFGKKED